MVRRCVSSLVFACAALAVAAAQGVAQPCDPATYVTRSGLVFTVAPSGGDDTACLQYALDQAAAAGHGAVVQLLAGSYKTAQLFVRDLHGALRGQGMDATTVRNLDTPLPMPDPYLFWYALPSPDNKWPWLISVVGGDAIVSDLAVHVVGLAPFDDWYLPEEWGGFGPLNITLAAFGVQGSETAVAFERVRVAGEGACDTGVNTNVGIALVGPVWGTTDYQTGFGLTIDGATFDRVNWGVFTEALEASRVDVTRSRFEPTVCLGGFILGDVRAPRITAAWNDFAGPVGVDVFAGEMASLGVQDSSILVGNNRFAGTLGVWMESNWYTGGPMFVGQVECVMLGNNVQRVTQAPPPWLPWVPLTAGYYLEPPIHGCVIVGHGRGTAVDLGTDNRITGVTKRPAVGPYIAPVLRGGMGLPRP